ncbi:MAG TPA: hypothetical protein ENJ50_04385, partial [Planctomycetaceae bacterium]|nr:hypothetical protein [Planctomycetaceae bacterium]
MKRAYRHRAWVWLAMIAFLPLAVLAQEGTDKKGETSGGDTAAAKSPASSNTGKARAEFEQRFAEWKKLLQDLRKLRTEYQTAATKDVPAIEKRWKELIRKGEAMLPSLREAALAAYRESPNT